MSPTADDSDDGDVRVAAIDPIRGDRGRIELTTEHTPDGTDETHIHHFVFEYEYDDDRTPDDCTHTAHFVSWDHGSDRLHRETFRPLAHVEQYLRHYGVAASPLLAPEMYRMIDVDDAAVFADDIDLDVTIPDAE